MRVGLLALFVFLVLVPFAFAAKSPQQIGESWAKGINATNQKAKVEGRVAYIQCSEGTYSLKNSPQKISVGELCYTYNIYVGHPNAVLCTKIVLSLSGVWKGWETSAICPSLTRANKVSALYLSSSPPSNLPVT